MAFQSARNLIGITALDHSKTPGHPIGTIEAVTADPATMRVDGFLIGRAGSSRNQSFIPLACIADHGENELIIHPRFIRRPVQSHRIIGLSAWTDNPRMLVGFVHDFNFAWESGLIESFVIHQLIRKWTIPSGSVAQITPHALLIHNDTTIKLKITPFPADPA